MNVQMIFGTIQKLKVSQAALTERHQKVLALVEQEDVQTVELWQYKV